MKKNKLSDLAGIITEKEAEEWKKNILEMRKNPRVEPQENNKEMAKTINEGMKFFLNGSLIDEGNAGIPFSNKHAFFDYGAYDNVKVIKGKVVFAEKHASRFAESLKILGIEAPSEKDVLKAVDELIKANNLKNSLIRLVSYPNFFYAFPVGLTFYPDKFYSKGVKAVTYFGERLLPKAKSMNLLLNYLAFGKAEKEGALEALLVNSKGEVTEGTRSNLFIVEKGRLITPPANDVLEGVTRELIMKEFDVSEEKISLEKALEADEAFISSTSMLAMPLNEINGKKLGQEFPITRKVLKRLKELEAKEVEG